MCATVLIFCTVVMLVAILFGLFGARRHNKFALSVAMCSLVLACSVTLIVAVSLFVAITPKFSQPFGTAYVGLVPAACVSDTHPCARSSGCLAT